MPRRPITKKRQMAISMPSTDEYRKTKNTIAKVKMNKDMFKKNPITSNFNHDQDQCIPESKSSRVKGYMDSSRLNSLISPTKNRAVCNWKIEEAKKEVLISAYSKDKTYRRNRDHIAVGFGTYIK